MNRPHPLVAAEIRDPNSGDSLRCSFRKPRRPKAKKGVRRAWEAMLWALRNGGPPNISTRHAQLGGFLAGPTCYVCDPRGATLGHQKRFPEKNTYLKTARNRFPENPSCNLFVEQDFPGKWNRLSEADFVMALGLQTPGFRPSAMVRSPPARIGRRPPDRRAYIII